MWERPLRNSWYSRSGRRRRDNPWERLFGIPSAFNHGFGRHALIGSPLRFTDAIFLTGDLQPALFSPSTFNFSADGTQ